MQPTDWAVPRISLRVPESSPAKEWCRICRAMLTVSTKVMFPLCLMFFCFFLSLGGSFRALMIRAEPEGTTSIWACLFGMVSFTVILRPFQSPVALAMSSPTFFGDRSRRLILGARADVALTSPLGYLGISLVGVELRWYGRACWCQMNPDSG